MAVQRFVQRTIANELSTNTRKQSRQTIILDTPPLSSATEALKLLTGNL